MLLSLPVHALARRFVLASIVVVLTAASARGQVYVKKTLSDEYRVYQRVQYVGSSPLLPLWQVHVIKQNLINNTAPLSAPPEHIGSVWGWVGAYTCAITSSAASTYRIGYGAAPEGGGSEIADWVLYDTSGSAVDAENDWSPTTADFGTSDDGEGPSSSRPHARTDGAAGAAGAYAELTVTVPADWSAATLDVNFGFLSNANVAAQTEWTLYYNDSGTYRQIPLNGRGAMSNQWNISGASENRAIASMRNVTIWDVNGTLDQAQQPGDSNITFEIARDLKPGTYKFRTKTTVDANRNNVGRARLHRQDPSLTPMSANAVEYFSEFPMDTQGSLKRPGPLLGAWTSSMDFEIKYNGDSLYANGPNYGQERQTGMTLTGDGADLTGSTIGQFYGPYSSVVFSPTDKITRTTTTATGSGASGATVVQNDPIVQLAVGTSLTADMVGDFLRLTGRTDGIDSGPWFEIIARDDTNDRVTVSPTPTGTGGSNITWGIYSCYLSVAKTYTFSNRKMRFVATCDWLKDVTISRLYIGNWRPFSEAAQANWFGFIPRHSANVHPYNGTRVEYIDKRNGLPTWSFDMVRPSKKVEKARSDASHTVATTGASSTITFTSGSAYGSAVAGDSIYIGPGGGVAHTDGIDGTNQFVFLTAPSGTTATVAPTPTQTISGSTYYIGSAQEHVYTSNMQTVLPLIADRRVFHYNHIEQWQNRGVGRVVVVDIDYWNWVGTDFLTNGESGFTSGSEDMKSYNTAMSDEAVTAAGANGVFSFELFVAEAGFTNASGGSGRTRLGF